MIRVHLGREDKCMGPSVMKTGPGWLTKGSPTCLEQWSYGDGGGWWGCRKTRSKRGFSRCVEEFPFLPPNNREASKVKQTWIQGRHQVVKKHLISIVFTISPSFLFQAHYTRWKIRVSSLPTISCVSFLVVLESFFQYPEDFSVNGSTCRCIFDVFVVGGDFCVLLLYHLDLYLLSQLGNT